MAATQTALSACPALRHGHVARAAFPHLDRGRHRGLVPWSPEFAGLANDVRRPDKLGWDYALLAALLPSRAFTSPPPTVGSYS
jgi:hypothetical protein